MRASVDIGCLRMKKNTGTGFPEFDIESTPSFQLTSADFDPASTLVKGAQEQCEAMSIAVIDDRLLLRECFARSIEAACEQTSVFCFSTVDEWQAAASRHPAVCLILLCRSRRNMASINHEIEGLAKSSEIPVILVSDKEDAEAIHKALKLGARGFIPASVNLRLAVRAMRLVKAGAIYVPESILHSPQSPLRESDSDGKRQTSGLFTEREAAVVDALRQGKPNKIIAYELNMRESAVKIHIKNIMNKLKAKNRTEVLYIINNLVKDGGTI
jgi:DNA-binding NarL/FixJ family response regulator